MISGGTMASQAAFGPDAAHLTAQMKKGSPSPKNTLTELDPVTLPSELSAFGSMTAAVLLAKVSGSDVPKATKVMAVTVSFKPIAQPNRLAKSPIRAVTPPIIIKETPNVR
eukprot:Lithocolla_globosa_v1_NODE_1348_length_2647_cov_12.946373.p3 type:complete len:111 gc:universal NODE_1348_length_2647_cov_12.946373:2390-2058(-)